MPTIVTTPIPTGGCININYTTTSGAISLSRAIAVSGVPGAFTTLYTDNITEIDPGNQRYYIDTGDQLPGPLSNNLYYVYQIQDTTGTALSAPVMPYGGLSLLDEAITQTIIRLFQAGLNNLALPPGMSPVPQVVQALPLTGTLALPLIVIFRELLQQDEQQIGEDQPNPDANNDWVIAEFAKYTYRISILSNSAAQRDYFSLAIIGIFKIIKAYFLENIGVDVVHSWQAASYQISNTKQGELPAAYCCDVMISFSGTFNMLATTQYGIIANITAAVDTLPSAGEDGVILEVILPIVPP